MRRQLSEYFATAYPDARTLNLTAPKVFSPEGNICENVWALRSGRLSFNVNIWSHTYISRRKQRFDTRITSQCGLGLSGSVGVGVTVYQVSTGLLSPKLLWELPPDVSEDGLLTPGKRSDCLHEFSVSTFCCFIKWWLLTPEWLNK